MKAPIPSQGYISVTGGRVWYQIIGAGPGLPLLTLHGGPGANSASLHSLAALANERPVIFYDQLGGGKSDRPDDPALWVLDRFVEELAQVRAALRLSRFHLFGHSWGTMLAAEYALRQPGGLTSLILAGPTLSVPRYMGDVAILKQTLSPEAQEAIDRHEAAGTLDTPEYGAAMAEWMGSWVCRNETILEQLLQGLNDPDQGINPQVYLTMQGPSEFSFTGNLKTFDCTPRLPELKIPTLFTCGRYDESTPSSTAWYHSLVPGSEMVIFANSAHLAHLEEPELYLQTVREFLRRVER